MSTVTIQQLDLDNPQHEADLLTVFDAYVREEIINGAPLDEALLKNIVPGLKAHGGAVVLLGYLNDEPAGMAICLLGFSTFAARPLLNIHDFAVHPSAQGRGVGRQLMDAVVDAAAKHNCCKVTLEVSESNTAARRLYEKCGFDPCDSEDRPQLFWTKRLG